MKLIEDALKSKLQNIHLQRDLRSGIRRMLPETVESITPSQTPTSEGAK